MNFLNYDCISAWMTTRDDGVFYIYLNCESAKKEDNCFFKAQEILLGENGTFSFSIMDQENFELYKNGDYMESIKEIKSFDVVSHYYHFLSIDIKLDNKQYSLDKNCLTVDLNKGEKKPRKISFYGDYHNEFDGITTKNVLENIIMVID